MQHLLLLWPSMNSQYVVDSFVYYLHQRMLVDHLLNLSTIPYTQVVLVPKDKLRLSFDQLIVQ